MALSPDAYRELIEVLRALRDELSKVDTALDDSPPPPRLALVQEEAEDA